MCFFPNPNSDLYHDFTAEKELEGVTRAPSVGCTGGYKTKSGGVHRAGLRILKNLQ